MIIEVKKSDVYIPDYKGNLKLSEGEQIRLNPRFTTPGEKKKYFYTQNMKVDKITGEYNRDVESVMDLAGLTKAIVTSIDNYSLKKGKQTIKIDTVDKLYNTEGVDPVLVARIETGMLIASPEVDADFLSQPSPST